MTTRVLVVCTANICRSPLAAAVLRGGLPDAVVTSAGTNAMPAHEMCAVSASMLQASEDRRAAVDHRSHQVTREAIVDADLVITMEREQRSAISRLAPGSQGKVFTLTEAVALAHILDKRGDPLPPDPGAIAHALHSVRGLAPMQPVQGKRRWFRAPAEPSDPLTIVDGHGLGSDEHLAATRQVRESAEALAATLSTLAERS